MVIFFWFLLGILSNSSPALHDFHMSKTEVNYNDARQTIEVSIHIFIDDLESAIIQSGTDSLFLATSKEHHDADRYIAQYLSAHFMLEINGEAIPLVFIGKEESPDLLAFWCYMEGIDVQSPDEVSMTNNLLIEVFDDQQNMVVFTSPGFRKFQLLNIGKPRATISIE